ncbi:integumentary mucin C.1-like [Engraulis encrasicolus]|uniref:integumentary mucin C.1-like n=1 Tax=Engraulis encrasicolus TaxID=184585 RepID=UPI002FCF9D0A
MIFDGYCSHVMSGASWIITTALIVVSLLRPLHCKFIREGCSYVQTINSWKEATPEDYRLNIPFSGDKPRCVDIKRALINTYCLNENCIKESASCHTKEYALDLIRCFPCQKRPIICLGHQGITTPSKYISLDDLHKSLEEKVCPTVISPKDEDCSASTTPAATTAITTTTTPPTTTSTTTPPTTSTTTTTTTASTTTASPTTTSTTTAQDTVTADSPPSHAPQLSPFSEALEKSVLVFLIISLCLNVFFGLLLLKQRRRHTQVPNGFPLN